MVDTHMKFRLASLLIIIVAPLAHADGISDYQTELNIPYCRVNGQTLTLNAFLPVDATNAVAAMVDIHGGWWFAGIAASEPKGVGGWQMFVRHRLAIFSINYRLGSGGGFPQNICDCRNAIRFIRKNA